MARKVEKPGKPAAPKGAAGSNDLEVLRPDRTIAVDGRAVTMREYRFWEGIELQAQYKPFFDGLFGLFARGSAVPSFEDVAGLLGEHQDTAIALVARACGQDSEWIRGLDDQDGMQLIDTWWLVNAGFFIRRVIRQAARQLAPSPSDGPASSTPSSPADTSATPMTSPA